VGGGVEEKMDIEAEKAVKERREREMEVRVGLVDRYAARGKLGRTCSYVCFYVCIHVLT